MAVNEIQVGRYNGILHKLFSMKEGAPAPTLAPEVSAGFTLESDRPEWAFLAGDRLCAAWGNGGPAPGQTQKYALRNPVNSGVIAVVTKVKVWASATAPITFSVGLTSAPFPGGWTGFLSTFRDTRLGGFAGAPTTCQMVGISSAGAFLVLFADVFRGAINTQPETTTPYILAPGTALVVEDLTANLADQATFEWRERALDSAETR
jgi:hypothetical protein